MKRYLYEQFSVRLIEVLLSFVPAQVSAWSTPMHSIYNISISDHARKYDVGFGSCIKIGVGRIYWGLFRTNFQYLFQNRTNAQIRWIGFHLLGDKTGIRWDLSGVYWRSTQPYISWDSKGFCFVLPHLISTILSKMLMTEFRLFVYL